jgi:hypothetical protein
MAVLSFRNLSAVNARVQADAPGCNSDFRRHADRRDPRRKQVSRRTIGELAGKEHTSWNGNAGD